MLKEQIKLLLSRIVPRLPWGVKETLFDALVADKGIDAVVARTVPQLGPVGLWAEGEYGLIQSAANDTVVLPMYARQGTYAQRLTRLVGDFFAEKGPGTFIDIGGNIGLTTIPIARDPRLRCLSFEPEPTNFANLEANVARNCPHGNVTCHRRALFSRNSTLSFSIATGNLGDHRISLTAPADRRTIEVPAVPLDDYLPDITGPLAVKIDTQGAEPFVIEGGRQLLARAGLVFLEFSPYLMGCMGSDHRIVMDFLADFPRIGLGSAEGEDLPELRPWAEVAPALESLLARGRNDGHVYADVIALR